MYLGDDAMIAVWPADELEFLSCCPICDSPDRELVYSGLTDRLFNSAPGEWSSYRCKNCLALYINPRPRVDVISRAYANYVTHQPDKESTIKFRGWRLWLKKLCEGYRYKKYGVKMNESSPLGQWLIPLVPSLQGLVDAEMRHLGNVARGGGGSLLDIGCGNAGFLLVARSMGWKVKGVDFDHEAVKVGLSQGLDIVCGGVEELRNESACYDVITISHVLEHVHDARALLESTYRLLKPGGKVWIETPNISSLGHKLFARNWFALDPPRHLTLFSPGALQHLLTDLGFSNIRIKFRGLNTFAQFAASEALSMGVDPWTATRAGAPPFREYLFELYELLFPSKREFLTLTAEKSVR